MKKVNLFKGYKLVKSKATDEQEEKKKMINNKRFPQGIYTTDKYIQTTQDMMQTEHNKKSDRTCDITAAKYKKRKILGW